MKDEGEEKVENKVKARKVDAFCLLAPDFKQVFSWSLLIPNRQTGRHGYCILPASSTNRSINRKSAAE